MREAGIELLGSLGFGVVLDTGGGVFASLRRNRPH